MSLIASFDPLIGALPRVLILGSMPGVISLNRQQYYAHPRNQFWAIMSELLGLRWDDDYAVRIAQLKTQPLILWDVLRACQRKGSLDSAIAANDLLANDITGLLELYPEVSMIAFNGAAAEKYFQRLVAKHLSSAKHMQLVRLPSTSPANAGKNFQQKLLEWRVIQGYLSPL
ncbi:MAG: DNA-deoxyinosine glycosylase [Gammaproteobacteria bacterium]|nr:DNA-deoxyinosine glycosylase [Gammaproteobacteria bacterium]MBL6999184.1 DNA-deoxyinosine glycosylase [Gammaproteobacteria bacterium]